MFKYIIMTPLLAVLSLCACRDAHREADVHDHGGHAVTLWSARTELFAEFPHLVAGREADVALHLTDLRTYAPVTRGRVAVRVRSATGEQSEFARDSMSSPGIYRVPLRFPAAGTYRLTVVVQQTGDDTIAVDGILVSASDTEPLTHDDDPGSASQISFLKEQQWNMDFRCEVVREQNIRGTIEAVGEIVARKGGESVVAAPFSGYCPATASTLVPSPGARVRAGAVLARLMPSVETQGGSEDFRSRLAAARAARENALRAYERGRRLLATTAIAEKEFQEIEAEWLRASETYDALSGAAPSEGATAGISRGAFLIRAPMTGVITRVHVTPGRHVEPGQPLFEIVDTRSVCLRTQIPMSDVRRFGRPALAAMQLPGTEIPHVFDRRRTRRVSDISMIDARTRALPVLFEVANPDGVLVLGMTGRVQMVTEETWHGHTVPESALLEDQGRYFVFIQTGGESFERREVRLGCRQGDRREVIDGLRDGERVVTVGAPLIRLASSVSSVPAHGHTH